MSSTQDRDPRVRKTLRALNSAAAEILVEGGWAQLNVANVCARADVARSTFYLHYAHPWEPVADKLLSDFAREFGDRASDPVGLSPETLLAGGKPLSYPLFAHAGANRALYARIFEAEADAALERRLTTEVARVSRAEHAPLREMSREKIDPDLVAQYLAGALVATLRFWVQNGFQRSAEQMAYWFSQMAAPGLLQTMGLQSILDEE